MSDSVQSTENKTDFRPRDRWLNVAVIIGPVAALANLGINYTFTFEACANGSKLPLNVTFLVCLLLSLSGAAIARWQVQPHEPSERTIWTGQLARGLSFASAVIIIAMQLPVWILNLCQ
jgi:hypothetical protein